MSNPFEWRIQDIERKADEANRRIYEIGTLRSHVDSLEHANRELCAEVTRLRFEFEDLSNRLQQIEVAE